MSSINKDIAVVRELAKQYMEIATSDKHVRMRQRFRDTNDLKIVRPPVIMEEIPWHEMNYEGALDCVCEDGGLRNMEWSLRVHLYREKYFKCDNFIEPFWAVHKSMSSTGNGLDGAARAIIRSTDKANGIVSHQYEDILADEQVLEELYHDPVITAYPERDAANLAWAQEILGDIMPVILRGHGVYYAPWDQITMLRGIEPILMDMYDNPDYLHRIIGLYTRAMASTLDQMEANGLFGPDNVVIHSTPGYVTLPVGSDPEAFTCKNSWFRTMAQSFSSISPAMHYEFDMAYSAPLASRFAYTYYGCCEPLNDRIDYLKKAYPNLRKVGVSPWANIEQSAEMLGGDYVYSRKPNPAHVAHVTDPDLIRREITETIQACRRYGCPVDITLKDISTVGYRPENLMIWAKAVSDVLDEYYGEA